MAKNILQDIVPPEKRSIRNIPLPPSRKARQTPSGAPVRMAQSKEALPTLEVEKGYQDPFPGERAQDYGKIPSSRRNLFSRKGIWIASFGAIALVLFTLISLVSGATITIRPHVETVSATGREFVASNDPLSEGAIPFQIITVNKSSGMEVTATGEEEVERKASGEITIFNDFDTNEQRLIRNTRFETPEGLIYRINESVVVPGQTKGSNGVTTPGKVTVTVYADEAGERYNVDLKDFTIPGFEGDPRFEKMYARSETPMGGGFVGTVKTVSENEQETAQTALRSDLETQLKAEIESQVPEGFMIFDDGFFFSFEALPQSEARGNLVNVNEKGTLSAVMFSKSTLANLLSQKLSSGTTSSVVSLANIPDLVFIFKNKDTFSPERDQTFSFEVQNDIVFVSQFNSEALRADLAGRSRKDFSSILSSYPAIADATQVVRPFWKRNFPNDPQNIEIVFAE